MTMNTDHEASRPAFEATGYPPFFAKNEDGTYKNPDAVSFWEVWKIALDYAASRECVWNGFSTHGRTHYRTCRGILNYTEMPRLQFIPFCPACGGRVKIQPQANEEQCTNTTN